MYGEGKTFSVSCTALTARGCLCVQMTSVKLFYYTVNTAVSLYYYEAQMLRVQIEVTVAIIFHLCISAHSSLVNDSH